MPVDRLVGIGLVRPFTDRPVSGVCASVSSRPVPPRRGARAADRPLPRDFGAAKRPVRLGALRVMRFARADREAVLARALRFGALARAVLRGAVRLAVRALRRVPPLRAVARALDPARLFDRVRFRPLLEP